MAIKEMLSKLTETLGSTSENLFKTIFKPLQSDHPRLFKDAVAYCLAGEPVSVLLLAQQTAIQNPRETFGALGTTEIYWHFKKSDNMRARANAYARMADGRLTPNAIMRMGKLFAELLSTEINKHTHDDFPDWLHVILSDWLYWSWEYTSPNKWKGAKLPVPSLAEMGALCNADDLPETTWLFFYLDRKGTTSYWGFDRCLEEIRRLEGLDTYFIDQKSVVLTDILPRMAAGGKAQLLIDIGELRLNLAYCDYIIDQSVATSKRVRTEASRLMAAIPVEEIYPRLEAFLTAGKVGERKQAAELIGRTMGETGRRLLETALAEETIRSVQSAIEVALGAVAIQEESASEDALEIPTYEAPNLTAQVDLEVVDQVEAHILRLQEKHRTVEVQYAWQREFRKKILALSHHDAAHFVKVMNGQARLKGGWHAVSWYINDAGLLSDPTIELVNVMRLLERTKHFNHGPLAMWLKRQPQRLKDLRILSDVIDHLGWPADILEKEILEPSWRSIFLSQLPAEGIWPYFADRTQPFVTALMGQGGSSDTVEKVSLDRVLEVLDCFPRLPADTRAPLLQLALGEGKTYRGRAQVLLDGVPGIETKVAAALSSSAQEVRANAARWLGRLGKSTSVAPLKAALAKESRELVRATMIGALEQIGEDIRELLHPDILKKEALKGLKKKMPKGLAWFPLDSLPALKWMDGGPVDPAITRWWVILASKVKDPGGNLLAHKYLQLLEPSSRQSLGLFVLRAFIAQDTLGPTLEAAEKQASQGAASLFQQWQHWIKQGWADGLKGKTLEDAHATIRREVLATYLGSAIKEKGVLALCAYCDGGAVVPILRSYMKDHYTRRHQIEAMLRAVAPGDDSHTIQLLLSLARRYRTRSVQQAAVELVQAVADRNGWSQEQLADRTIPTAGFEADGSQVLDYGTRQFTLRLDDQLKPLLINEKGKAIKSLPAPRQADDADRVKETRARFSAAKKELKQVVALTSGRFYEAMCAGRRWPVAEWREYLCEHPVVTRLLQRLVWRHQADGDDDYFYFRPSEDGGFIDAADEERELIEGGRVSLAHRSLLSADEAEAWQGHLQDYGVKPLFEQVDRPAISADLDLKKKRLDTYTGYLSDTFTLRGTLTKLGYQRGVPEDGGFFYYYFKDFISANLRAVVFFSGNCVPEENMAAALEDLAFCSPQDDGWFDDNAIQTLDSVPPILLSEVLADYEVVASKTGGFDPDWKQKMPW